MTKTKKHSSSGTVPPPPTPQDSTIIDRRSSRSRQEEDDEEDQQQGQVRTSSSSQVVVSMTSTKSSSKSSDVVLLQQVKHKLDLESEHFTSTIALCSTVLTFFYILMSVFPYSGFMVMHLIRGVDHEHAGIYAGFLASSFMIGRAITSYPLGLLGDIYGRKFVLCFTSIICGFGSLLFGVSTSYTMAIIIRFIMGKKKIW